MALARSRRLILTYQAGADPNESGQTFAEAKAALTRAGYTVEVSSSFGDKPQDECRVIREETATAPGFAGGGWPGAGGQPRIMLSLDCSAAPKS